MTTNATLEHTTIAGFPALRAEPAERTPGTPTLVFLHGAFADHTAFEGWLGYVAAHGYPAVAASRRGRLGVGPDHAAGLTFDDYLADTLAVLDALGEEGERPVLVGHSLGGLVAQRLAEQGRARAIVLLASAPPSMLTAQRVALPHFGPNVPKIMSGKPFIVPDAACSVLALNKMPEAERPAIHAHLCHESGKVYRALMFGSVKVDAAKVEVPVLVAGGDEDRIISARLVRSTAKHYGVEPHVYEGHAHWLLAEPGWEQIADDVLTWLAAT